MKTCGVHPESFAMCVGMMQTCVNYFATVYFQNIVKIMFSCSNKHVVVAVMVVVVVVLVVIVMTQ